MKNLRNFWVELFVDGRTPVSAGPRGSTEGFSEVIYVRNNGESTKAAVINGHVKPSTNELVLDITVFGSPTEENREGKVILSNIYLRGGAEKK